MENELTNEENEWMSADLSAYKNDKLVEELYNVRMALNPALFNQRGEKKVWKWNKTSIWKTRKLAKVS